MILVDSYFTPLPPISLLFFPNFCVSWPLSMFSAVIHVMYFYIANSRRIPCLCSVRRRKGNGTLKHLYSDVYLIFISQKYQGIGLSNFKDWKALLTYSSFSYGMNDLSKAQIKLYRNYWCLQRTVKPCLDNIHRRLLDFQARKTPNITI